MYCFTRTIKNSDQLSLAFGEMKGKHVQVVKSYRWPLLYHKWTLLFYRRVNRFQKFAKGQREKKSQINFAERSARASHYQRKLDQSLILVAPWFWTGFSFLDLKTGSAQYSSKSIWRKNFAEIKNLNRDDTRRDRRKAWENVTDDLSFLITLNFTKGRKIFLLFFSFCTF